MEGREGEKGEFGEGKKVSISEEMTAKSAETHFRVMESYNNVSLLSVEIKTGRTHQIRIHMTDMGHPLVGDKVYHDDKQHVSFKRQALHADTLEFKHPVSGKKISIKAPLPLESVTLHFLHALS